MKYLKEYINWNEFEYEEYDENDFNNNFIGIKTTNDNVLINWYYDEIPNKYIIHGSIDVDKSKKIKIVDKYEDFYIVRYTSTYGTIVQLGFKKDDLEWKEN